MSSNLSGLLMGLILVAPIALPPNAAAQPVAASPLASIDADAVEALDRMGTALRALHSFRLHASTTTDYVLDDGQKLALAGTVDYTVQEPDHFVVDIQSEKQHRQLFSDGKTLTIYSPRLKYSATLEGLDRSTRALVASSASTYGVEFPLADLFLWGTSAFPTDRFSSALHVGREVLDGDPTQHYAYRLPGVDWQVWISDVTALPRRLVITSHSDPALPVYQASVDWDTKRAVRSSDLVFKPSGATRILLVPVAVAANSADNGDK